MMQYKSELTVNIIPIHQLVKPKLPKGAFFPFENKDFYETSYFLFAV